MLAKERSRNIENLKKTIFNEHPVSHMSHIGLVCFKLFTMINTIHYNKIPAAAVVAELLLSRGIGNFFMQRISVGDLLLHF